MALLGVVQEVQELQLRLSLPGHLQGFVPITNISPAYTAYLRYLSFKLLMYVHTRLRELYIVSTTIFPPPPPKILVFFLSRCAPF
jgi:hypothetical protein